MFEVVITSFNRPNKVKELASNIFEATGQNVVVVDSGGNCFQEQRFIRLIRSSHKNQPYQRYLGFLATTAKWILYLDDDMEPIEGWVDKLKTVLWEHSSKALISLCFKDRHDDTFIKSTPQSVMKNFVGNPVVKALRWISGYPILSVGRYYKNGVKGPMPEISGWTEYTRGGAFIAKREYLYENFNMQLFDLYEQRMGKGEDGILSYSVSKTAPLFYYGEQIFWHNDQGNSVYSQNHIQFNKVVAYSRAYLNYEYFRLNGQNLTLARLIYINFGFWRLLGLLINLGVSPSRARLYSLIGWIKGIWLGIFMKYDKTLSRNEIWKVRAVKDLSVNHFKLI